jgi:hypothetical protein
MNKYSGNQEVRDALSNYVLAFDELKRRYQDSESIQEKEEIIEALSLSHSFLSKSH